MQQDGRFPGFTLPEGAWLPPEILMLLPDIRSASELKITIAAIYEALQIGGDGAVISLTDFQSLTGLDAKGVLRGIKAALKRGTLKRERRGQSYFYRLAIRDKTPERDWQNTSGKMPVHVTCMYNTTSEEHTYIQHEGQDATGKMPGDEKHLALLREMRELGVALKVAQNLLQRYDVDYLREKLRQARFALEQGLAQNAPGWFVASVRDGWGAPLGYDPNADLSDEERRKRYITGKYADFIEH